MIEHIINLLAPHSCVRCHSEGSLLCLPCGRNLADIVTCRLVCEGICGCRTIDYQAFAVAAYEDEAKELVRRLKFGRAAAASRAIAELIADQVPLRLFQEHAIVTHVPTAASRVRQRGYDQAALIARHLARLASLPYASLLSRSDNRRQVGKNRRQRLQQTRDLFSSRPRKYPAKHVLLVDDVLTTGATLHAAALALRRAGVEQVTAVVFAAAKRFG